MAPPPSSRPRKLLVEGPNDLHTVSNLLNQHNFLMEASNPRAPHIQRADGVENITSALLTALLKSNTHVGIIVDADLNAQHRWERLRQIAPLVFQPLMPPTPAQAGFVATSTFEGREVTLGVWMMPDNHLSGKIEDFLAHLIPPGDPTWGHAQSTAQQAQNIGAPFRPIDTIKAQLHTWLAWREVPGQPFGQALTARCFDTDAALARRFVAWFLQVFP